MGWIFKQCKICNKEFHEAEREGLRKTIIELLFADWCPECCKKIVEVKNKFCVKG